MAAFIAGEGNWLPMAMTAALLAGALVYFGAQAAGNRPRIMATMNVFVGVMLAFMGAGHLLAVGVKQLDGVLRGSPWLLYPIGIAIVLPSSLIIRHTRRLLADADRGAAMKLHGWLAATLLVLGLINTPLAVPALLSMAYARHSRRATGIAIVSAFALVNAGLLIGGLLFMLSGARTFEEFNARP
jgi:hypothetical protein